LTNSIAFTSRPQKGVGKTLINQSPCCRKMPPLAYRHPAAFASAFRATANSFSLSFATPASSRLMRAGRWGTFGSMSGGWLRAVTRVKSNVG
jgi:hypothetical protein